jgi:N-acetyl-gamma-glutamyl-phosphate reductase
VDVGVVGGSGYAGGELLRLLAAHPALKVRVVAGRRSAGQDLRAVYPHLGMDGEVVAADPAVLGSCDLVFLATPHAVSLELAPALVAAGTPTLDLSGAFRLPPATFTDWYGDAHPAPELAPAPYGLPELFRAHLPGAPLVAVPGCYPTAALLALAPLAGLVDPAGVVVNGLSGWSGAGAGLRDDLHASHASGNLTLYGAPRHRHTPEIEQGWAALAGLDGPVPLTFTPHLVPLARGLVCTVTAPLLPGADPGAVRAAADERYAAEPFVTVLPEGAWPSSVAVRAANTAHVGVATDPRTGRVTVACAIDNLTKGAAGQAVQAANVVLGLPEPTGLPTAAVYP